MTSPSFGICSLCKERLGKAQMARHLNRCAPDHDKGPIETLYRIHITSPDDSLFWIDLEIKASAKLADLDDFLREVWLECCGHMSTFQIGRVTYMTNDGELEPDQRSIEVTLARSLGDRVKQVAYKYDFGSTTDLTLTVTGMRDGGIGRKKLRLLARNEPPEWSCSVCGAPATLICAYCRYQGDCFSCDQHADEHECTEEAFLPVVNSPRMGVCGYTGPLPDR